MAISFFVGAIIRSFFHCACFVFVGIHQLYASAIFGQAFYHQELHRLTDTLTSLGYAPASQKSHIRQTGHADDYEPGSPSGDVYAGTAVAGPVRQEAGTSRYVGRVSHALAAQGIISGPMRMRNYTKWYEKPVEGIVPA